MSPELQPEQPVAPPESTRVMRAMSAFSASEPAHPAIRWPLTVIGIGMFGVLLWADIIHPTMHPLEVAGWSWVKTSIWALIAGLFVFPDLVKSVLAALPELLPFARKA